jgi:hypothetical protein
LNAPKLSALALSHNWLRQLHGTNSGPFRRLHFLWHVTRKGKHTLQRAVPSTAADLGLERHALLKVDGKERIMLAIPSHWAMQYRDYLLVLWSLLPIAGIHGCAGHFEDRSPNKTAWAVALKAEAEATFRDARYLLSQINMTEVTDQDLKEAIEYHKRLCSFCIETGIPRDAKLDTQGMLSSINYKTVAKTLIEKGITRAHEEARRLADDGTALITGLDKYCELREVLARRYR